MVGMKMDGREQQTVILGQRGVSDVDDRGRWGSGEVVLS